MNTQHVTLASYAATGTGIALLALQFVFPYVFPDQGAWSESQAQELASAAADLHRLTHELSDHGHSHGNSGGLAPPAEPAQLAAAQERWKSQENRLNAAVAGRQTARAVIKWLGILLAVAGGAAALWLRVVAAEA